MHAPTTVMLSRRGRIAATMAVLAVAAVLTATVVVATGVVNPPKAAAIARAMADGSIR